MAIDLSKAFTYPVAQVLESRFNTCTTCIGWNGRVSHCFSLAAGMRQGGLLSPLLLAILIDTIVDRAKTHNVGCYINTMCCSRPSRSTVHYADDTVTCSYKVTIKVCDNYLNDVDMCVNKITVHSVWTEI